MQARCAFCIYMSNSLFALSSGKKKLLEGFRLFPMDKKKTYGTPVDVENQKLSDRLEKTCGCF